MFKRFIGVKKNNNVIPEFVRFNNNILRKITNNKNPSVEKNNIKRNGLNPSPELKGIIKTKLGELKNSNIKDIFNSKIEKLLINGRGLDIIKGLTIFKQLEDFEKGSKILKNQLKQYFLKYEKIRHEKNNTKKIELKKEMNKLINKISENINNFVKLKITKELSIYNTYLKEYSKNKNAFVGVNYKPGTGNTTATGKNTNGENTNVKTGNNTSVKTGNSGNRNRNRNQKLEHIDLN